MKQKPARHRSDRYKRSYRYKGRKFDVFGHKKKENEKEKAYANDYRGACHI
jgi:hypothetical protein